MAVGNRQPPVLIKKEIRSEESETFQVLIADERRGCYRG